VSPPPDPTPAGGGEPLPRRVLRSGGGRPSASGGVRSLGRLLAYLPAFAPIAILAGMFGVLVYACKLTLLPDFFSMQWDPPANQWGVGVFVAGSFITAVPALILSMAIGLGIAIASTTYLPRFVSRLLDPFVDLLAGIPSVVYGIWAFIVVGPVLGKVINPWVFAHFHTVPGFGAPEGSELGTGLPLALIVLTLMALPITTLLIRDALRSVPKDLWESGLALGATRWEVTRRVAIPYSLRGIVSAAFLGFGRAFGETVAVAMVIGSIPALPDNAYAPTYTIAAAMFQLLDSSFSDHQFLVVLTEMALVLMVITLVVNLVGRRLISNLTHFDVPGL